MKSNPFTTTFGIEPIAPIKRVKEADTIISEFNAEPIANYVYLITGPRGSGKTVLQSSVSNELAKSDDWIVIAPGPKEMILENIASEIYETTMAKKLFLKGEFSFSFQGISFSLKGKEPTTTANSLIKKMVGYLNKKGKRVLITIDEIDNNEQIKLFVQAYQSLIR
jgi:Cdc6-like AAA superfamily ATPase